MNNFIRDKNRFALAAPPQWWLRALWEFDPSLVLVPSRVEAIFRIAQRRPVEERPIASHVDPHPDTRMLNAYGLVPVTTLVSVTGGWTWSSDVFEKLRERAGWRRGLTPAEAADAVEAKDAAEKAIRHAARDDRLTYQVGKWAPTVAKWKLGQRVLVGRPSVTNTTGFEDLLTRSAQRVTSAPPSGSTGTSDAV